MMSKTVTMWEVEKRVMDKRNNSSNVEPVSTQGATIKSQVVLVSPEVAEMCLRNMGKNRKLPAWNVDRLAKEMVHGRWSLNGVPIIFDNAGKLIDGQTRLNAVIQSGQTVPMVFMYGVHDPNAFRTIDTNQVVRGAHTILGMEGVPHGKIVAAVSKRLLHWENTPNKTSYSFKVDAWRRVPPDEVVSYGLAHQTEIITMIDSVKSSLPHKRCKGGSSYIAALVLCHRVDEIATMLFNEGLKTGVNLPEKSSVALLRDRLIMPPERGGVNWELELMALIIKAWNYFVSNKPMTSLRWRQDGDAPERFPTPGALR